ncbi:MAG TPA: recombinase family protein, partial [Anaerolineaceae bacterium]
GFSPFGYCRGLCADCQEPNGQGYCPEYGSPNKTDGKHLILHPIDSEVVRLVFKWYLEGDMSYLKIADRLNHYTLVLPNSYSVALRQRGHPGYSLPGPFTRDYIRDIMNRIFYTGKLPYLSSKKLGGLRTKRSDLRSMELFDGQHPPLVSEEEFRRAQELRSISGFNCRNKDGQSVQIFPLTGILFCGNCGSTLRGVSSSGRRYYRDSAIIDRTHDCQQKTLRADKAEQQLVTILHEMIDQWQQEQLTSDQPQKEKAAEDRFERAKELYIAGEITREAFQQEKNRYENTIASLQNSKLSATMALIQEIQAGLCNWDQSLPTERKKLLRKAFRAAFVRGDTYVALQPTEAFSPLVELLSCHGGEGGIRTHG